MRVILILNFFVEVLANERLFLKFFKGGLGESGCWNEECY
jgi:hypothetical protein